MDTLFASRLTTTRRLSSEVRAMVVEWLGVLSFGPPFTAPRPIKPTKTSASAITERDATRLFSPRVGQDRINIVRRDLIGFITCSFPSSMDKLFLLLLCPVLSRHLCFTSSRGQLNT